MFSFVGNLKLFIMELKELRIGNTTFEYNKDDKEWIVSNVSCWDFERARLNNNEIYLEHRKPIPLTEQILLKCPQFKQDYPLSFKFKNIRVESLIDKWCVRLIVSEKESFFIKDIYFLHDFQNTVKSLTNEELTVNL